MLNKIEFEGAIAPDRGAPTPMAVGNFDLRRLQAFVVAAETQNFGTAARQLSVVPSAISHAIRSLETELGCELFQRKGPRVALAPAGFRLMPLANEVLNLIQGFQETAKSLGNQGTALRISLPEMLCARLLPAILHDFNECMPGVKLNFVTSNSDEESWKDLRRGRIDLSCSPTRNVPLGLASRVIYHEHLGLYASADHPLAQSASLPLPALTAYPLYVPDADASELLSQHLGALGVPAIDVLPSMDSMHNLTLAGHGISMLPNWAIRLPVLQQNNSGLVRLPVRTLQRSWSACWHTGNKLPWALEVLTGLMEIFISEIHEQ